MLVGNAPQFVSKRGRPTVDQANAIQRSILDAAAHLFLAEGFKGTSIEAVADRAGVPRSTVYKRYGEKPALLRAVLADQAERWSVLASRQNFALTEDLEQRLRHHAVIIMHFARSAEVQAIMALARRVDPTITDGTDQVARPGYSGTVSMIESDIRVFGPACGVHAKDPRSVASVLVAMLTGWARSIAREEGATDAQATGFVHRAVDLVWAGRSAW